MYSKRSQRRSRLGCGNCKRRKVKCDEIKPECTPCIRHAIHCDFSGAEDPHPPISSSTPTLNIHTTFSQRVSLTPTQQPTRASCSPATDISLRHLPFSASTNATDLHIMYHYSTTTCFTFGFDPSNHVFWQSTVPKLAFSQPHLLHFILALSALHIVHTDSHPDPEQTAIYLTQAESHYTLGLKSLTSLLPENVSPQNCEAVFISAVLICCYTFARGPKVGEYIAFSEHGPAELLVLLKGVRSIIESMTEVLHAGILVKDGGMKAHYLIDTTGARRVRVVLRYQEPIWGLRQYVENMFASDTKGGIYLCAIDRLYSAFDNVYQVLDPSTPDSEDYSHIIFGWLYTLSEEFICCLERKESIALVILGYFTVLMRDLERYWFMKGCSRHVMEGVCRFLGEGDRRWVEWPLRELEEEDKDRTDGQRGVDV